MKECIGFISDLCAIRNAAAHGRSILPIFMDPDYNGNWDLEFDNVEGLKAKDIKFINPFLPFDTKNLVKKVMELDEFKEYIAEFEFPYLYLISSFQFSGLHSDNIGSL